MQKKNPLFEAEKKRIERSKKISPLLVKKYFYKVLTKTLKLQ